MLFRGGTAKAIAVAPRLQFRLQRGFLQLGWICKLLKIMVGERGFEPPTPWSRTSFWRLLKFVELHSS
jgi:hypothetical protein